MAIAALQAFGTNAEQNPAYRSTRRAFYISAVAAMNFASALIASDPAERDRLISAEVAAHDWLDVAARHMEHGGWPEQAMARVLSVEPDEAAVRVKLVIDLVELCPQGCNAYPRRFSETAIVWLVINRSTGVYEIVSTVAEQADID
jgi:hypothetical protein